MCSLCVKHPAFTTQHCQPPSRSPVGAQPKDNRDNRQLLTCIQGSISHENQTVDTTHGWKNKHPYCEILLCQHKAAAMAHMMMGQASIHHHARAKNSSTKTITAGFR